MLIAIGIFIGQFFLIKEDSVMTTDSLGRVVRGGSKSPSWMIKILTIKNSLILFTLSLVFLLWQGMFFIAEQGYNYYLQYPTGGTSVKTNSIGITWRGFAKITALKDYVTVSSEANETSGQIEPISGRFSDKVTGSQRITVRFKLPDDDEQFKQLIVEFRTLDNLITTSLKPLIREVVSNTPYMFTGQGYASGKHLIIN